MSYILDQPDYTETLEEDLRYYFGPNSAYFLRQWHVWSTGISPGLNPAALIFGVLWFVYRQMWLAAGAALLLFWVSGLIEQQALAQLGWNLSPAYGLVVRLVGMHLLIGLTANRLYLIQARRQVQRVRWAYPAEETREQLKARGGTSRMAVVIFLLLLVSVSFCQIWGAPVSGPGRAFS